MFEINPNIINNKIIKNILDIFFFKQEQKKEKIKIINEHTAAISSNSDRIPPVANVEMTKIVKIKIPILFFIFVILTLSP